MACTADCSPAIQVMALPPRACGPSHTASLALLVGCELRGDEVPVGRQLPPQSSLDTGEPMPKLERTNTWPYAKAKKQADMTLDDVRALIKEVRNEGLRIQSHYKRLNEEYSDWEDRVNELEKIIYQAEIDTGLTKEEIYKEPNEFADELGEINLNEFELESIEPDDDTTNILDNPP